MRRIVRLISQLTAVAARIGVGDFSQQIAVKTGDEIGRFDAEFTRMATALAETQAQLRHRAEQLQQANQALEEKTRALEEETRALEASHEELIAARLKTEEALRESEERNQLIVTNSLDAVMTIDSQGLITSWNPQAERLFGWPREEVLGRLLSETIIPPAYRKTDERGIAHFRATGEGPELNRRIELTALHRNGTEFPVELAITPMRLGGDIVFSAFLRDITERKRAQEALEEKTRALAAAREELIRKERLAILGLLAGGVSHELRNPLGVIKNSVYYLKMVMAADEKVTKHLGILEREIVTANRIVTGLIDFARVTPPNRVAVDLSRVVREYLEQKPLPGAVEVVLELADSLPAVSADPDQFLLVLGNLVTNAVQAMPEGGKLTITTVSTPDGVSLSVADTGTGIAPENLAKIFEPLFTTKPRGIGLGLAVAQSLSESNGATLTVASAPGQGSRFVVHVAPPHAGGKA